MNPPPGCTRVPEHHAVLSIHSSALILKVDMAHVLQLSDWRNFPDRVIEYLAEIFVASRSAIHVEDAELGGACGRAEF